MNTYEKLLEEASTYDIVIDENSDLPQNIKGLFAMTKENNLILISKKENTTIERTCILAEELGHYHTTSGNITDLSTLQSIKQEKRARVWSYEKLMNLPSIIEAYNKNISTREELAEHLGVTERFIEDAIQYYYNKYGMYVKFGKYIIQFSPLAVIGCLD